MHGKSGKSEATERFGVFRVFRGPVLFRVFRGPVLFRVFRGPVLFRVFRVFRGSAP
jgi:hypothetical protein